MSPPADNHDHELALTRESLRVSEEHFRLLVQQVSEYAIFLLDTSGHIASWNAGAARIKGYSADEIIGQHFSKFYRAEDVWKCPVELETAIREGRCEDEGWRVRKDGTRFWANVVITCLRDATGAHVGFAKVTRDMTERRRVEDVLRQSEERFRLLVESVKDYAIFMLDPSGVVATWNAGAQRIKGYRASEIVGQHFSKFYPQEDIRAGKCEMELETAIREGRCEDEGWRIRKDGTRFWANVVITALRDEQGAHFGFAKVTRDLTERRAAEQERSRLGQIARTRITQFGELSESLASALSVDEVGAVASDKGQLFAGADTCAVYALDEQTHVLKLLAQRGTNPALIPLIQQLTPESGSPYATGVGESDGAWIETAEQYLAYFPALAGHRVEGTRVRAFWCVPLIAERRSIGMIAAGFHEERTFSDEDRAFVGTFSRQCAQALARAQRHEAERSAAAHAARLEARRTFLVDAATALAESLDYEVTVARVAHLTVPRLADWCAVDLRIEGERMPRRLAVAHVDPAKIALANQVHTKYPPDPDATSGVTHVLRTGRPELYSDIPDAILVERAHDPEHLRIVREIGLSSAMIVPLVARSRVLGAITFASAESGRRYTADDLQFAQELAERCANAIENTRVYRAEQHARRAADAANRAKDEFLAIVSHELRTPLNAIMGWAQMLTAREMDETRLKRAHDTIERNAVAMAQLIEDLLDMSRVISGKMRLEVQHVEFARVVDAAIESIRPAALAKAIDVSSVLDTSAPALLGDPARLQQVVWNLLSNAVKFTPKGGRVSLVLRRIDSSLELRVTDSGQGIAPDFLPSVFEAFRQEDSGPSRQRGGLGLGLAISRQLVELHGGRISAASDGEGRGATFTVTLPVSAVAPAPMRLRIAHEYDAAAPLERPEHIRGLRVLVVDDEEDARRLVAAILEDCGCLVRLASSVEEAMQEFAVSPPDLLLSDIGMPGQTGFDLIRLVRRLPRERGGDVPAAALTAYARAEDRRNMLNAGYSIHVPKPVEPAELIAVVATLSRFIQRI